LSPSTTSAPAIRRLAHSNNSHQHAEDRSIVRAGIVEDQDDATIVRTIIDMGKSMKWSGAEGVETKAQLDYLKQRGCHYAQGRLFGDASARMAFLALMIAADQRQLRIASLFA